MKVGTSTVHLTIWEPFHKTAARLFRDIAILNAEVSAVLKVIEDAARPG